MIGFVFGGLGVVLIVRGYQSLEGAERNLRRRRRALVTPVRPLGSEGARGGAPAAWLGAHGHVETTEQGTVRCPFSERDVVWLRTVVEERRSRGRSSVWVVLSDEVAARDFVLRDASGRVRVRPQMAHVTVKARFRGRSGLFRRRPPEVMHYLAERGASPERRFFFEQPLRWREESIAAGEALWALGPSHLEAGAVESLGYRSAPTLALVLGAPSEALIEGAPEGQENEVLLSDCEPPTLARRLLLRAAGPYAMLAVGAALTLWALISLLSR